MKKRKMLILAAMAVFFLAGCGSATKKEAKSGEFTPSLDTESSDTVEIAGFMGNFEALDSVINSFNEIYPNVVFTYDHNTSYMLSEYLTNNTGIDIFMTEDQNLKQPTPDEYYVQDRCLDLSKENVDVSGIRTDALTDCTVDGELLRLPVAMNTYGIVVNETLLKNEGLSVPTNYEEFLDVLATLKEKGYTPLQGSQKFLYGELMVNMAMNLIHEDKEAAELLLAGDEKAADVVKPAFERLETIINEGYTDYDLNCTFPEDNYDGSILAFFDGKMPFYVCNAECVSGMKKRESKSETYSADPFDYEFLYAPVGDSGAYAYMQPWYGFSINKDSDVKDMAVEFLRYMATQEEIDEMASIKGMPSAAINGKDERYSGIKDAKNIEKEFINDGSVPERIRQAFVQTCNDFGAGVYANADEAVNAFVQACKL